MADLDLTQIITTALTALFSGGVGVGITRVMMTRGAAHKLHAEARAIDNDIMARAAADAASAYGGVIKQLEDALGKSAQRIETLERKLGNLETEVETLEDANSAAAASQLRCEAMFETQIAAANRKVEELTQQIANLQYEREAGIQREEELRAIVEEQSRQISGMRESIQRLESERDAAIDERDREIARLRRRIGGI